MSLSRWSQDDVSCGTLPSLSEKDGPIRSIYEDRPCSCLSLQDGAEGAGAVSGLSQIPAPESLDEAVRVARAKGIIADIESIPIYESLSEEWGAYKALNGDPNRAWSTMILLRAAMKEANLWPVDRA